MNLLQRLRVSITAFPCRRTREIAGFFLCTAIVCANAIGQTTVDSTKAERVPRKFYVSPSSTSLAGGKARLVVSGLTRDGGAFVGDYQIKVAPYFFKNETGKLSMAISDASLSKLTGNSAVEFTGKATTNGTNKSRPIKVKAVPTTKLGGALMISVATENGALVFDTSYKLGEG